METPSTGVQQFTKEDNLSSRPETTKDLLEKIICDTNDHHLIDSPETETNETPPIVNSQSLLDFKKLRNVGDNIKYRVNYANSVLKESMAYEKKMITNSLKRVIQIRDDEEVSFQILFDHYFGQASPTFQIFQENLHEDYEFFLKFLSTTMILQSYRLSITMLFESSTIFDKKILMVCGSGDT